MLVQACYAALASEAIHPLLRQHGPQPTLKRAAARIRIQFGDSRAAVALAHAEKLGIKGIREFTPSGFFPRDRGRGAVELVAVTLQENFPRPLDALGAGAGQDKFFQPQRGIESAGFVRRQVGSVGVGGEEIAGRLSAEIFSPDFHQDVGKLFQSEIECGRSRISIELLEAHRRDS